MHGPSIANEFREKRKGAFPTKAGMVLKIRLARWGARNNPFYGIVLAQQRAARDGKHLERLGTYNPIPSEDGVKHVELNCDRIKYWLSVGAQPTERAAWLLAKVNQILVSFCVLYPLLLLSVSMTLSPD